MDERVTRTARRARAASASTTIIAFVEGPDGYPIELIGARQVAG